MLASGVKTVHNTPCLLEHLVEEMICCSESNWREPGILSSSVRRWETAQWTFRRAVEWHDGIASTWSDQHQTGLFHPILFWCFLLFNVSIIAVDIFESRYYIKTVVYSIDLEILSAISVIVRFLW